MARKGRLWAPALVAALVAALLGSGAGAAAAPEPRTVNAAIMIPAAMFGAGDSSIDNSGYALTPAGASAGGALAPLAFPVSQVSIRRITAYVYDNTSAGDVHLTLMGSYPPAGPSPSGGYVEQGILNSSGASGTQPQILSTSDISPRQVNTSIHGCFLVVSLAPGTHLYGVKVLYSYEIGG